mmetsp:Transcript_23685/g.76066  ORF Transcript_23685/g.76066 Transcript_23685/m.76066 type:complete len:85 (-) Transcript_23685:1221-1475(-)
MRAHFPSVAGVLAELHDVVDLDFSTNSLYGEIPASRLAQLPQLRRLDLADSEANGTLPQTFLSLAHVGVAACWRARYPWNGAQR